MNKILKFFLNEEVYALYSMTIPKFLADDWLSYLTKCNKVIDKRLRGYRLLKHKLYRAGYGFSEDGYVLPF